MFRFHDAELFHHAERTPVRPGGRSADARRQAGCARVGTSRHARACLSLPMVSL